MSTICTHVEYSVNQNCTGDLLFLQVNVSDCFKKLLRVSAQGAVVHGVCGDSLSFCTQRLQAPPGMHLRAYVQRLEHECDSHHRKTYIASVPPAIFSNSHFLEEMFYETNEDMYILNTDAPLVKVDVQEIESHDLIITDHILKHSGYLTAAALKFPGITYRHELKISSTCVVLISIQQSEYRHTVQTITLMYREPNATHQRVARVLGTPSASPSVFVASYFQIRFRSHRHPFLKIYYSTLFESHRPQKLLSSLFNCSVDHYWKFKDHLHCNLKPECEDGRDETEQCPFSSPGCQGLVASHNKCFKLTPLVDRLPATFLQHRCQMMHQRLASIKTRKEKKDFMCMFRNVFHFKVPIGIVYGWHSVPFTYSKFPKWSDNTLVYNLNHNGLSYQSSTFFPSKEVDFMMLRSGTIMWHYYSVFDTVVCEIESHSASGFPPQVTLAPLHSPPFTLRRTRQIFFSCPESHLTHLFLLCDADSQCGRVTYSKHCRLLHVRDQHNTTLIHPGRDTAMCGMFGCDDDITRVHYTLVCDFRQDCPDNSDEIFCEHPSCHGFLCLNGQCVLKSQLCNQHTDCFDDSDETGCPKIEAMYPSANEKRVMQRFHINLDGTGYFTGQVMTAEESCPDSHYRCTAEWLYCLPVYTRCNGFSDCVYGEDEQGCEGPACPGLYQCRAATVCVHGDHLCDGWGQCPQRDDELLCDMTCPEGCLCQGHCFLCSKRFSGYLFPALRYLDGTDTLMSLTDFTRNAYLISLTLSHCSLRNISTISLTNLQYIDLANNHLKTLPDNAFRDLPHLRTLHLSDNPLRQIAQKLVRQVGYELRTVDVSKTHQKTVNSLLSIYLPRLKRFNVSFSAFTNVMPAGFKNMLQLTELDIRENPVRNFPFTLLTGAKRIKTVLSSDYRFCCENLLPRQTAKLKCLAPHTVLPSCQTLAPTEMHRTFFWFTGLSAILGNLACFLTSFSVSKLFGNNFLTAIGHLQLANICMGCNVGITVIADGMYQGIYIQKEKEWTDSASCRISAFLSLVSNEVSVLIIWFIILDHTAILCSPGHSWRWTKHTTTTACRVAWCAGVLVSLIPFLPGLSHWGLHGQSGLCRMALYNHYYSHQDFRWFTVTKVVNFVLCLLTVGFLVVMCTRTPEYRIALTPNKRSLYSSVHVMKNVAVANAACWLSFGLVTMMTSAGVTVLDKIHGAMVVFVLPLSSALYPFLYMWTVATQRQGQAREEKLLEVLKSRLALSGNK